MSVGLLLITHNDLGATLLETATKMLACCPLVAESVTVTESCDPELLRSQVLDMLDDLDQGDGVLVLTDMFGSTPANIAASLARSGHVSVTAGVNLPMVVRVLNYAQLDLRALTQKAISGGREGVIACPAPANFDRGAK